MRTARLFRSVVAGGLALSLAAGLTFTGRSPHGKPFTVAAAPAAASASATLEGEHVAPVTPGVSLTQAAQWFAAGAAAGGAYALGTYLLSLMRGIASEDPVPVLDEAEIDELLAEYQAA